MFGDGNFRVCCCVFLSVAVFDNSLVVFCFPFILIMFYVAGGLQSGARLKHVPCHREIPNSNPGDATASHGQELKKLKLTCGLIKGAWLTLSLFTVS